MLRIKRFAMPLVVLGLAVALGQAAINMRNSSTDRPIILDKETDYVLQNVMATGMRDAAALTLTGRISTVTIRDSSFGNVRAGESGKAAAVECVAANVRSFVAINSIFFDAENQIASFREGSFGLVSFRNCSFRTSDKFLKDLYADNAWRDWPPVTEFYNIDTLELLDNTFANTIVVIHPSVRKVIIRGEIPGLQVKDEGATQVIHLEPGAPSFQPPVASSSDPIVIGTPW